MKFLRPKSAPWKRAEKSLVTSSTQFSSMGTLASGDGTSSDPSKFLKSQGTESTEKMSIKR